MEIETAVGRVGDEATDARWSEGRPSPLAPVRLGLARSLRGWRLLLALGLGMLVTVVLLCTVPLYTTLVPNVELQNILDTSPPVATNFELQVAIVPYTRGFTATVDGQASFLAQRFLASFAPSGWTYSELSSGLPVRTLDGKKDLTQPQPPLLPNTSTLPMAFDYAAAQPHMRLLSGRLPQDVAPGQPFEVLVTPQMGLVIGNTMQLGAAHVAVKVVGVWQPKDPNEAFWNLRTFDVQPSPSDTGPAPTYPLLFSLGGFRDAFIAPEPAPPTGVKAIYSIRRHYVYFTQHMAITTENLTTVQSAVRDYRHAVNTTLLVGRDGTLTTQLDNELAGLVREVSLLAQPLYIVVAQVVALALLFIAVIGALIVEGQAAEIATLKSRGASVTQLLTNVALQGLALALLAAAAGPFLAFALSLTIVRFFVSQAASLANGLGTSYLAGTISPRMVVAPAAIDALLGEGALALAAWRATRLDVLAFRREEGREEQQPFWKRYYLDLLLAALCVAGYVELGQFGGLNVRAQPGQQAAGPDFLQLAAPALLLLAGALVALRLFPLAMALGTRLAGRARGATGLLSFAQVARGSAQFARLTLLLLLAVGIGLFALTFQSSLARAASDRATFLVGSDQVLQLPDFSAIGNVAQFIPQIRQYPGVTAASAVYVSAAGTLGSALATTSVYAVDADTFGQVAYWRDDYADAPLGTLLASMRTHRQGEHAGEAAHPLWALVDQRFADANFLHVGDTFKLAPRENNTSPATFVVGAIISYFPSAADPNYTSLVVTDLPDYSAMLRNPTLSNSFTPYGGPNEVWLRTTGNVRDDALRAAAIERAPFEVNTIRDRRVLEEQARSNPLTAGMAGVLLAGAVLAALLAVLGGVVQSGVAARRRTTQFAILRTLGMNRSQMVRLLLGQQAAVYLFGLVGGAALGLALATATLPFLQFSTAALDPTHYRIPPFVVVFEPVGLALFLVGLVLAFALGLLVAARAALRIGLGRALRIGED
jgi:ABC-type lipoprotein release transport system permease subunit